MTPKSDPRNPPTAVKPRGQGSNDPSVIEGGKKKNPAQKFIKIYKRNFSNFLAKSNKKFFNWMQNNWMLNFDPKKTCTRIQFILAVLIGCYHFRHFCIQLLIGCKTIWHPIILIGCCDFASNYFNWMLRFCIQLK